MPENSARIVAVLLAVCLTVDSMTVMAAIGKPPVSGAPPLPIFASQALADSSLLTVPPLENPAKAWMVRRQAAEMVRDDEDNDLTLKTLQAFAGVLRADREWVEAIAFNRGIEAASLDRILDGVITGLVFGTDFDHIAAGLLKNVAAQIVKESRSAADIQGAPPAARRLYRAVIEDERVSLGGLEDVVGAGLGNSLILAASRADLSEAPVFIHLRTERRIIAGDVERTIQKKVEFLKEILRGIEGPRWRVAMRALGSGPGSALLALRKDEPAAVTRAREITTAHLRKILGEQGVAVSASDIQNNLPGGALVVFRGSGILGRMGFVKREGLLVMSAMESAAEDSLGLFDLSRPHVDVSSLDEFHQNKSVIVEKAIASLNDVFAQHSGGILSQWIYYCDYAVRKKALPRTKTDLASELRNLVQFLTMVLAHPRITKVLLHTLTQSLVHIGAILLSHSYKLDCRLTTPFNELAAELSQARMYHERLQEAAG